MVKRNLIGEILLRSSGIQEDALARPHSTQIALLLQRGKKAQNEITDTVPVVRSEFEFMPTVKER